MGKKKQGKARAKGTVPPAVADAALRLGLSLVAALVMAGPSLLAAARGALPLTSAALRFVVALVLARIAFSLLWQLYAAYKPESESVIESDDAASVPVPLNESR